MIKTILALLAGLVGLFDRLAGMRERAEARQDGRNEAVAEVNGERALSAEEGARKADENARISARRDSAGGVARRLRDGSF